jgi:hypothetical protein
MSLCCNTDTRTRGGRRTHHDLFEVKTLTSAQRKNDSRSTASVAVRVSKTIYQFALGIT